MKEHLHKYFGYTTFKQGQEETINAILSGKDVLAVMPTGGGKSLCYQLPALMLDGTAIVISPLIALMHDQYTALTQKQYPATYINSSLSFEEYSDRLNDAILGKYKLLYIAPERLRNDYFIRQLDKLKISFLAIDEAHCISEWGHDFRPAYLNIANALINTKIPHTIALTATATPDVQKDIVDTLHLNNPQLIIKGFNRENLTFITEDCSKKEKRIIEILKKTKSGSSIIYCGSRKKTEQYHKAIIDADINATYYHAGLTVEQRKKNQDAFIDGTTPIIFATNAFGLGIDKPNVRNVIHTALPGTIEAYYQEAGRAGRDGLLSNCYLLHQYGDRHLQEFFIDCQFPTNDEFDLVYQYLYLGDTTINEEDIKIANNIKLELLKVQTIINFFENAGILFRSNQQLEPKIQFLYDKETLVEYISTANKDVQSVLDALIRSFTNEATSKKVDIDITAIAKKYAIPKDKFIKGLEHLSKHGLIEYNDVIPMGALVILKPKSDISSIGINFSHIQKRRQHSINKFNLMMDYASTHKCKRNYILDYFNDSSYSGICEKCSSCTKKKQSIENTADTELVLNAANELEGRFGRTVLVDFLKGNKKNPMVEKYKLDKCKYFRRLMSHSVSDIYKLIDRCISANLLEKSDGQYPLISLTNIGAEHLGIDNTKNKSPFVKKNM